LGTALDGPSLGGGKKIFSFLKHFFRRLDRSESKKSNSTFFEQRKNFSQAINGAV
jgi:hypothetical protein